MDQLPSAFGYLGRPGRAVVADAFSAAVRIELHVAGRCLPVAQVGGGRLIFDKPVALPSGVGEVVVYIDEVPNRWLVKLPPSSGPQRTVAADLTPIA